MVLFGIRNTRINLDGSVIRRIPYKFQKFVAFDTESITGQHVQEVLDKLEVGPETIIVTDAVASLMNFVVNGQGIFLVYPLFATGLEDKLVSRPYENPNPMSQYLCYPKEARNKSLTLDFATDVRRITTELMYKY